MTMPSQADVRPALRQVLQELGGSAKPGDVYLRVAEKFPDLTPEDLKKQVPSGDNHWRNRVRFARNDLVKAGEIDPSKRGVWTLTDAGWQHPPLDAGTTEEPLGNNFGSLPASTSVEVPPSTEPGTSEEPIAVVFDEATSVAGELTDAAIDSGAPSRLEHACAEALRYFGFDVREIGGPGRTDVHATAPLGTRRYSLILDAKSTSSGRVTASQVDFLSLEQHRAMENADYIVVVGAEFAGGQLTDRAEEFGATLLRASDLSSLVRLHATKPLALTELRSLFQSSPFAGSAISEIRAAANDRARRFRLIRTLVETIDEFNRTSEDEIMAKPEVLWGAIFRTSIGTTRAEVVEILDLLATIGIVAKSNSDGYVSLTSPHGAEQMLTAFARPQPSPSSIAEAETPQAAEG